MIGMQNFEISLYFFDNAFHVGILRYFSFCFYAMTLTAFAFTSAHSRWKIASCSMVSAAKGAHWRRCTGDRALRTLPPGNLRKGANLEVRPRFAVVGLKS